MLHRALLPPALAATSLQLNSEAMQLGAPFASQGRSRAEGKAMQRPLSLCRQTRRWVIAHHDHRYSKEMEAGRAALVLDDVFSSR